MRAAALLALVLVAGCGTDRRPEIAPVSVSPPPPTSAAASPSIVRTPVSSRTTTTKAPSQISINWEITVYYTAVERFHTEDETDVTGCLRLDCAHGDDDLGSYPSDFVDAVQEEGTGLTNAGRYLNWSYDIGFWLDSAPRSSDGNVLTPFVSAAADPAVLAQGTRFAITDCGRQDDGSSPAPAVCRALRNASWRITDEFTPGLGGPKHIDAYIGRETGPGFTDSDWYITVTGARLSITS